MGAQEEITPERTRKALSFIEFEYQKCNRVIKQIHSLESTEKSKKKKLISDLEAKKESLKGVRGLILDLLLDLEEKNKL